jgi:hypothetical protein
VSRLFFVVYERTVCVQIRVWDVAVHREAISGHSLQPTLRKKMKTRHHRCCEPIQRIPNALKDLSNDDNGNLGGGTYGKPQA